jgi:hypothetical protein
MTDINETLISTVETILQTYDIKTTIETKYEELTRMMLFSKKEMLEEIEQLQPAEVLEQQDNNRNIANIIIANSVPAIDMQQMFDSFHINFIFNKDTPTLLYKDKIINKEEIDNIIDQIVLEHKDMLPTYYLPYTLYMNQVLKGLLEPDASVLCLITNMPKYIQDLYKIKCKKLSPQPVSFSTKMITDIKEGVRYKVSNNSTNSTENSIENIPADKDTNHITLNETHQLEIMSYLNDIEMTNFSNVIETLEKIDYNMTIKQNIIENIKNMLDIVSKQNNKLIKLFIANIMFKYILNCKDKILDEHSTFKQIFYAKAIEMEDSLGNMDLSELQVVTDFTNTLYCVISTLDSN